MIKPQRRRDAEGKRILLFAFFLLSFAVGVFGQDEARVSATWQVQKYDIAAMLPQNEADRNLTAKAKLDIKNVSSKAASTLTLRISQSAEISAVNVSGSTVDFTKGEEKVGTGSLQRVVVRMPSVQSGSSVAITVDYKLNVKDNSGLNLISPNGSQFLPLSYWYPTPNSWYFARGADYAPFKIQLNSSGQTLISSGSENAGSFESKSAGQPFFVAGSWDAVNTGGVSVYLSKGAGAEEQKRAAEISAIATEAKAFVANLLGAAPSDPIRIVSVTRGGGYSSGGTILLDDSVFYRSKVDSLAAMQIAEAIAKMWLGNSVAISGDGGGVIREGLTKFIATQFIESKYGKDVADVERLRQRIAYSSVSRRDAPITVVTALDDYYFPEVANKGAMIWRILSRKAGPDEFFKTIKREIQDGSVSLADLRRAFSSEKPFLDYMFDQVTDTNLLVGLPQVGAGETKVALRNTAPIDVTVNVAALSVNGQVMSAPATIRAQSFGEVVFKTPNKISRVEIDPDKLYPQTDYSDDVAPREVTDSDLLLAVKRSFDKQEFAAAEKTARLVLRDLPRYDDVRVLLARSILAQNRTVDAEKEFRAVLDEKLPAPRSLAWANVGLAEIATKASQNAAAVKFAEEAIRADAEYGASLAARNIRNRLNTPATADESVKAYFANFDRIAISNRKAEIEALAYPGEVTRFISGISGQTVEWKTQVNYVDKIDANNVLVETNLSIRLLNKETETGLGVFRLTRAGSSWKLSGVEIFEVR
jgi:hypothetical protein